MSLIGEAEVAARTGRLTEALELSDRASELTELVPLGATHNAVVRFFALLHLDRAAEADDCRRQLEALLDERDEGISRIWLLHLQGITHLGLGRPEAAATVYLRAEQLCEQLGIGEPCVVPWGGRAAIAHARAGRDADAARVLDWLDACAERGCRAATRGWPRRSGAPSWRSGRWSSERPSATISRRSPSTTPPNCRWSARPRSWPTATCSAGTGNRPGLEGSWPRPSTRPRHGRAGPGEVRPRGLSSAGGRRRRRTPDGHLTPQELRIARLVKAGSSRREIADVSRCPKRPSAPTCSTSTPSSTSTPPASS
jgi:hypothetical protein